MIKIPIGLSYKTNNQIICKLSKRRIINMDVNIQ